MAKGKKMGAAKYTDKPDEHVVVVINPWGMVTGRPRLKPDIDRCGSWLSAVFSDGTRVDTGLVEMIYTMDTVSSSRLISSFEDLLRWI